jgi:hypothetical protein
MKINIDFQNTTCQEIGFYQYSLLPSIHFIRSAEQIEDEIEQPIYILSFSFLNFEMTITLRNKN